VVECGGLENRLRRKPHVGSNPTLSVDYKVFNAKEGAAFRGGDVASKRTKMHLSAVETAYSTGRRGDPLDDRLPPFRRHFHEAALPAGRVSAAGLRWRRVTPLDVGPACCARPSIALCNR
jgi:hypothetical protein